MDACTCFVGPSNSRQSALKEAPLPEALHYVPRFHLSTKFRVKRPASHTLQALGELNVSVILTTPCLTG